MAFGGTEGINERKGVIVFKRWSKWNGESKSIEPNFLIGTLEQSLSYIRILQSSQSQLVNSQHLPSF